MEFGQCIPPTNRMDVASWRGSSVLDQPIVLETKGARNMAMVTSQYIGAILSDRA